MREIRELRELFKSLDIKKAMLEVQESDGEQGTFFYLDISPEEYQFWREGNMPTNYEDKEFIYETKF